MPDHSAPSRPRLRLAILGSSPCADCVAACCKQNGHAYSVLLQGEDERRRFRPFAVSMQIDHGTHVVSEMVIPYRDDGRCLFLGEDDRCTIYEDRPQSCRDFQCIRGYHHGAADVTSHSQFLQRNAQVREILDRM